MIKEAYLRHVIFYFLIFIFYSSPSHAAEIQYLFPLPDSRLHHPETQIIIRFTHIKPADIQNFSSFIRVSDRNLRQIRGMTSVSTDNKTISFMPYKPFEYGARIGVTIKPRLYEPTRVLPDTSFTFHVAKRQQISDRLQAPNPNAQIPSGEQRLKKSMGRDSRLLNGVSVPADFPEFDISINDNPDSGSIFLTTIRERGYALILDSQANLLFYWRQPSVMMSFKAQPDNRISVIVWGEEGQQCGPVAFDTTFSILDTFCPPPGYWFDEHELVHLENGHYLLIASDERVIDMSQQVEGGWERPCLTEVRPDGSKAFEMYTEAGVYRCTRFHWEGKAKVPYLFTEAYTDCITLLFNKFGDPDVARYDFYGGTEPEPEQLMASTDKPFIHLKDLTNEETWFFRVRAVNSKGEKSGFSNQEDLFVK